MINEVVSHSSLPQVEPKRLGEKAIQEEDSDLTSNYNLDESESAELPDTDHGFDVEAQIEKIVNFDDVEGERTYKVLWRGPTKHHLTWEHEESLKNYPHVIAKFYECIEDKTNKRDILKFSWNPQKESFELQIATHQSITADKLLENQDLLSQKMEGNSSDISSFSDSGQKIAEEKSSSSKEYSASSLESRKKPNNISDTSFNSHPISKKKKIVASSDNECCFFKGQLPEKILSHKIIEKTDRGVLLDLLVKWRREPGKKRRPPTYYNSDNLQILAPEILSSYYKKLLLDMLSKTREANHSISSLGKTSSKQPKTKKKTDFLGIQLSEDDHSITQALPQTSYWQQAQPTIKSVQKPEKSKKPRKKEFNIEGFKNYSSSANMYFTEPSNPATCGKTITGQLYEEDKN